jgi:hypothetical protein
MNAQQETAKILEQWLQLSQAEAGAIQRAAWADLKEIQAAKTHLQKDLAQARKKWEAENAGNTLSNSGKHPFHAELGRLISLATRNGELLAAQLRRAHAKRDSLNEAIRNLRKVQRSYSAKARGVLNCYS